MSETDLAELALQVAKEVMGCRVIKCRGRKHGTYKLRVPGSFDRVDYVTAEGAWSACPKYPTDWSAAGEVLERMQAKTGRAEIYWSVREKCWVASFTEVNGIRLTATGQILKVAICLAALAAVRAVKGG